MKCKKSGFTIVELLTAIGIVAVLVAMLVPALNLVRRIAKETQQKAQLTTIDMALTAFRGDYGEYPPSVWPDIYPPSLPFRFNYCGAQKLSEALLGWDLIGFHPDSAWRADGRNTFDSDDIYDATDDDNLRERRGPYLELATANAFKLGGPDGLFNNTGQLDPNTFVICDVFSVKKITVGEKIIKAGTPILYYRADPSKRNIDNEQYDQRIYNVFDNLPLINLGKITDGEDHPLGIFSGGDYSVFYNDRYDYGGGVGYGIRDPKVAARPWPYRPDSYILISAGADGEYGTSDDIRNF